jgi:CubicO group peptidase (beta-lactamase class C family)
LRDRSLARLAAPIGPNTSSRPCPVSILTSARSIREGIEVAAKVINERAEPQGTRFRYASAETDMLAAVLRGATGMTLSEYLTPRLWQRIGAETSALWRADRTGLERASGSFNATLRDFARLGKGKQLLVGSFAASRARMT